MRKKLTLLHFSHALTFSLLLFSGLFLYMPNARTWFNQLQFPLVTFHIITAFFYFVILLVSLSFALKYLLNKPLLKKYNVLLSYLFGILWITSGIIMYFQSYLPVPVRNLAVIIHDWGTFLFIPWALTHSIGHYFQIQISWPNWWRAKAPLPTALEENRLKRRDFVKFLAIGTIFVAFGGWIRWLSPILSIPSDGPKRKGYFRIYNVTNKLPNFDNSNWTLTIDGLVNQSISFKLADVPRYPTTTIVTDFHCVTGWSVRGVEMKGILMKDLFSVLKLSPTGKFVTAYSGDKTYFDSFTIDQIVSEEALLVFELDGQPLKKVQGYPCRLYLPSMYGYKSVKWLERLEFTEERKIGYWQQSGGYDIDGYL